MVGWTKQTCVAVSTCQSDVQVYQSSCLVGQVVKTPASRADDPEFDSRFPRGDFSGLSHTSDLKSHTPVATLPGAWPYRSAPGLVGPVSVH